MENAMEIASVMGPMYLIMGLSMLFYVAPWQKVLEQFEKNHFSLIPLGVMQGVLGLIVIQMYNVWEPNIWVIVTLTGWIMLFKCIVYFLIPGNWTKAKLKMVRKSPAMLTLAGIIATVVGAVLSYNVYMV